MLHNNRDNEEIRESDFDEIKQDVQIVRFEMLNNLRQTKEDISRYVYVIHNGISLIGEYLFDSARNTDLAINFKSFQSYEKNINTDLEDFQSTNQQVTSLVKKMSVNKADLEVKKKSLGKIVEEHAAANIPSDSEATTTKKEDTFTVKNDSTTVSDDVKMDSSLTDLNAIKEEHY